MNEPAAQTSYFKTINKIDSDSNFLYDIIKI